MTTSNRLAHHPTFLGIGAQKCGTTWLHSVLQQHPDLSLPRNKETHFFDNEANYSHGASWYLEQFPNDQPERLRGEVTPGYLWVAPPPKNLRFEFNPFRSRTPERILALLGEELKLIVMLRNPVDRAISAYVHHASKGRFVEEIQNLAKFQRFGIAHMGQYHAHISRWLDVFPKDRFRFYCFEDVRINKDAFYKSIFEFLGVPNLNNVKDDKPMQLFAKYQRTENGVLVSEVFSKQSPKSPLQPGDIIVSPEEIEYLQTIFVEDVERLNSLEICDLSRWKSDFVSLA